MINQSAISFPCDFPIKVIGHHKENFETEITQIIEQCRTDEQNKLYPIIITKKPSKENRYLALTVTVHVEDQAALDDIYRAISKHPDIKMVL